MGSLMDGIESPNKQKTAQEAPSQRGKAVFAAVLLLIAGGLIAYNLWPSNESPIEVPAPVETAGAAPATNAPQLPALPRGGISVTPQTP